MDTIANLPENHLLEKCFKPTLKAFLPLLIKNEGKIRSIESKTYQFGDEPRQKLDVYLPKENRDRPPILLFTYGGSLAFGDRILKGTRNLIYTNIGAFFTLHGYLTVIADYRLAPKAVYPAGLEDVRDALRWIITHLNSVGDTSRIFLLSHSAGVMHQASAILHPTMLTPDMHARICGAIFISGAYHLALNPNEVDPREFEALKQTVGGYLQNYEPVAPNVTLGLLRSAPQTHVESLPPIMLITGEHEPKFYMTTKNDFASLLRLKGAQSVTDIFNPRHNHLSTTFALCSGEGEEWARDVLKWMKRQQQSTSKL